MTLLIDTFCLILFLLSSALHVLPVSDWSHFFQSHYSESGIIEYASIMVLVIAAVLSFLHSKRDQRKIYWLLLSFVFLFFAGEEMSWFQRLFNIEAPEFFKTWNDQQEINLHGLNHDDFFLETFLIPVFALIFLPWFLKAHWKLKIRFLIIGLLECSLAFQVDQEMKESFLEEGFELISYIQFVQLLRLTGTTNLHPK